MEYKDYYKVLGVPRTASAGEVKKAFRRLARELHPDKNAGDKTAERRFKDVNEANAVLSDPEKRRQYDTLGANWEAFAQADAGTGGRGGAADPFGPGGPFAGYATTPGGGRVRYEFRTSGNPSGAAGGESSGFSDFFRIFFGGEQAGTGGTRGRGGGATFDDVVAQMGIDADAGADAARGSAGQGRTARPRPTVEATADLSLEESFHGTTRLVEVGGKRLEVTIPRGVDTGAKIRLSGKGGDGRDLVVAIKVRPHPVFTRRGADLERELLVTLKEALLGAEVPVPTLKGRVLLTIPPGTQNGRTFRLKAQGMPRYRADGAGELYVKVRVVLPSKLGPDAESAARTFLDSVDQPDPRQTGGGRPRPGAH